MRGADPRLHSTIPTTDTTIIKAAIRNASRRRPASTSSLSRQVFVIKISDTARIVVRPARLQSDARHQATTNGTSHGHLGA